MDQPQTERRTACIKYHSLMEETKDKVDTLYKVVCGNGNVENGMAFKLERTNIALEKIAEFITDTKKIRDRLWGAFYTVIASLCIGLIALGGMFADIKNVSRELYNYKDYISTELQVIKSELSIQSEKIASLEDIVFNVGIYKNIQKYTND